MKQHITLEQLNELSEEARLRLKTWWKENYHILPSDYPTPNIGHMIEFLDLRLRDIEYEVDMWYVRIFNYDKPSDSEEYLQTINYPELCDALWEAVKENL